MAEYGDVFIYTEEFFQVVSGLREHATPSVDVAAVSVPDTLHIGANATLNLLAGAIDDARAAIVSNVEVAARILTAAGANTITADMGEEGVRDYTHLASPGDFGAIDAPTDDVPLYGDVAEFVEGSEDD
jgi:hypothetical protein